MKSKAGAAGKGGAGQRTYTIKKVADYKGAEGPKKSVKGPVRGGRGRRARER